MGGYLLGLGEIALGSAILVGGFALEVATVGGFTIGVGVTTNTGAALILGGLATTTYHAQDISMPWKTEFPRTTVHEYHSNGIITIPIPEVYGNFTRIEKNDGTPSNNSEQNKQADDARKEIERELGRKMTKDEKREFHDHVSGQGYGYHELIDEGYWLFHGR